MAKFPRFRDGPAAEATRNRFGYGLCGVFTALAMNFSEKGSWCSGVAGYPIDSRVGWRDSDYGSVVLLESGFRGARCTRAFMAG